MAFKETPVGATLITFRTGLFAARIFSRERLMRGLGTSGGASARNVDASVIIVNRVIAAVLKPQSPTRKGTPRVLHGEES